MDSVTALFGDFIAAYAGWLVAISLASIVVGLVFIPIVLTRIPADYFSQPQRRQRFISSLHPIPKWLIIVAKNLFGLALVLTGILLLFMPGQGLLTLFVGLIIMDYPGKYAVERRIIESSRVLAAANWLRAKYDRPPLEPPGSE